MPTLSLNGLAMRVETYGTAGEPILLLHGALSDHLQNWRMILGPLGERFRLIAVDMRGHGGTNNPSGIFTLAALRDDALAVLDALDIPKAHLLGCSLGGYVAMALRAAHPERAGTLALAGVKVGWTEAEANLRASFFQADAIAARYPLWIPHMAKAHAPHYGIEHWKTLVGWVYSLLSELPRQESTSWEALRAEAERRALFYALGDRDELVPLKEVLAIREAREDAEILVLPRSGHLFREYNPHVFVAAYGDFLKKYALRSMSV